ncbi:hypothetical protein TBR22_A14240 [Luteitalea sp. TBR-22]|uniref:hypothetical protein n=1 Tax=Luteitalea sp. TBR-22 TaxID=2802971 RepID=UPI001AF3DBC1|nr:hypothetical protein [Luteitalea sp. TBR-22]BCS32214.1 hypothetical protein TBR22_A14240 [Luteitalea sp. TBR-22]
MRTILASALGLLTLAGVAAAQPLPSALWAGGVIVKVDTAARTIAVRQGSADTTYVIAENAEVKDGKKTVAATDLGASVGQQVKVYYSTAGDTRTASKVTLLGVPTKGTAAAVSASVLKGEKATTPE